jgi:hypothetical protein
MAGKVLQWDYDEILAASEQKCCFSLQKRDVALILAITEQMKWKTRYISPSGATINTDWIDTWASGLERRLMDGCCPDGTLSQFTDDGIFQTSVDGGATWQDNPDDDPRNQGTLLPPLGAADDSVKCAAADNVRASFVAMRDNTITLLTAGTTLIAILAGLAGFVGVVLGLSGAATAIGVLLLGLSAQLLSLTPESVAEQIDDEALDTFKCLVYCNMDDNGQFTYDGWQELIAALGATFTGFPLTFFKSITESLGYIGMSNAGTMGVSSADDCDCDCDCDGETVGLTLDPFFVGSPEQTGCNVKGDSMADGDGFTLSWNWDGTHPWKLTVEGILSGTVGSPTVWQWYLADGSGPFLGASAPIGVSCQTINIHGTGGTSFRASWDVATP